MLASPTHSVDQTETDTKGNYSLDTTTFPPITLKNLLVFIGMEPISIVNIIYLLNYDVN